MIFRLGLRSLSNFSLRMSTMLNAGLPIRRALTVIQRGARPGQRALYERLAARIDNGRTFAEALEAEGRAFPVFFLRLTAVAETSGGLDKVLKRLGEYYAFIRSVWMRLIVRLIYPAFNYWGLVFVFIIVACLPMLIAGDSGWEIIALKIFAKGLVVFCLPVVLYYALTRTLGGSHFVHGVLMRVPLAGHAMRTLALARFSLAMELMTEAGVRIFDAITWSLEATANGAFIARGPAMLGDLQDGVELDKVLEHTGLFPDDYVQMINVAHQSGSLPDMFARLSRDYFDRAETAMRALSWVAMILLWLVVAGVIIYYIFVYAFAYISLISGGAA